MVCLPSRPILWQESTFHVFLWTRNCISSSVTLYRGNQNSLSYLKYLCFWSTRCKDPLKIVGEGQIFNDQIITSREQRMSSTLGHTIWTWPGPSLFLSGVDPSCIEAASSLNHFSSKEPRDENCTYNIHQVQISLLKHIFVSTHIHNHHTFTIK